jgi:hypothetical protein
MERLELELRHAGKVDYDLLTFGATRPPVVERRMSGLVAGTPGSATWARLGSLEER